jgi:endonuclease/exonuclease/phosphatase family metal-dependent hydrolase
VKIVSWNANCKFRSKLSEVDALGWDILVVQECENPHDSKDIEYKDWAQNYFWVGGLEYKGLGLFMPVNLEAKLIGQNPMPNKYFITVQLSNGIQLLAVWTQAGSQSSAGYIYQLWEYLKSNEAIFDWDNLIVVGDWNSNAIWDTKRRLGNHTDVCNLLSSKGLVSCYHAQDNIAHGEEVDPTFFMHRNPEKPYHIDYLFAPNRFVPDTERMEIGNKEQWLQLSDHLPISYQLSVGWP